MTKELLIKLRDDLLSYYGATSYWAKRCDEIIPKGETKVNSEMIPVYDRISDSVKTFVSRVLSTESKTFYADELRNFVTQYSGPVAPSSPTRILQDLRKNGRLNYRVVSRKRSLYEALPN
jgi:hypothetical protein